jgi:hypothetical protein
LLETKDELELRGRERESKTCSLSSLQLQSPSFSWDQITSYEADLEESAFTFLYTRGEGKDPRWVKVYSPFFRYMEECVDRINQEILWKQVNVCEGR